MTWPQFGTRGPINDLQRRSRGWLCWFASDGSLTARSGQIGTLVRDSVGTVLDRWGNVVTVPSGAPRWCAVSPDITGLPSESALLLERGTTNRCQYSDDLTQWTNNGLVRTAAARRYGDMALTYLYDDSASVAESTYRTCSMSQAYATISAFMEQGDVVAASGVTFRLWDQTAGVSRGGVLVTWSNGVPTVSALNSASVGRQQVGPRLWRVWATIASGIVTGNTNRIEVLPATTASQLGSVYVGGVQVESGRTPTSVLLTGASTVTRADEVLTFPLAGGWRDRFTLGLQIVRPPEHGYGGTVDVAGGVTVLGGARLARSTTARQWVAYPTSAMSGGAAVAWPAVPRHRIAAQFEGYVQGGRRARIDASGTGYSAWTSASAGVVAPGTTLALHADTAASSDLMVQAVALTPGLLDYAQVWEMR